jgi:hypothetical protein
METQTDNITGMGTGAGRVQIRVSDPETQRQEIIERLKEHGIEAEVRSKKIKEWQRPATAEIKTVRTEKSQQKKAEVSRHHQVDVFNQAFMTLMSHPIENNTAYYYQTSSRHPNEADENGMPSARPSNDPHSF